MKFGAIVIGSIIGSLIFFCVMSVADAQSGVFNGAGIRMGGQPEPEPAREKTNFSFPKLFSADTPADAIFGRPPQMPDWSSFKNKPFDPLGLGNRPTPFQNMPRLFPERDPDQPNFLQQWNQKSKDFYAERRQRFDDWTSRTNETMKARSSNTWDSITKGFKPDTAQARSTPFDWLRPKQPTQPSAQPPIRSAQFPSDKNAIKFR